MIGIYKITNPIGQVYIGGSKDIEKRIKKEYLCNITVKKRAIHLSLDKYGRENHTFDIIEECTLGNLRDRERYWQELYDVLSENGLNGNFVKGMGKPQSMPESGKIKIRDKIKGRTPWNLGIPMADSTRKTIEMRYSPLNRKSSKIIIDMQTGVYYYCPRDASLATGIPKQTLRANLSAPNKDCKKNKTTLLYT